jgi:hypothetical protein
VDLLALPLSNAEIRVAVGHQQSLKAALISTSHGVSTQTMSLAPMQLDLSTSMRFLKEAVAAATSMTLAWNYNNLLYPN